MGGQWETPGRGLEGSGAKGTRILGFWLGGNRQAEGDKVACEQGGGLGRGWGKWGQGRGQGEVREWGPRRENNRRGAGDSRGKRRRWGQRPGGGHGRGLVGSGEGRRGGLSWGRGELTEGRGRRASMRRGDSRVSLVKSASGAAAVAVGVSEGMGKRAVREGGSEMAGKGLGKGLWIRKEGGEARKRSFATIDSGKLLAISSAAAELWRCVLRRDSGARGWGGRGETPGEERGRRGGSDWGSGRWCGMMVDVAVDRLFDRHVCYSLVRRKMYRGSKIMRKKGAIEGAIDRRSESRDATINHED